MACFKCWCRGLKLAGQRAFAYPLGKDAKSPLRTTAEMHQFGKSANTTGKAVNGIKGTCAFVQILNLPMQAAIDIAHTLVNSLALSRPLSISLSHIQHIHPCVFLTLIRILYNSTTCSKSSCHCLKTNPNWRST